MSNIKPLDLELEESEIISNYMKNKVALLKNSVNELKKIETKYSKFSQPKNELKASAITSIKSKQGKPSIDEMILGLFENTDESMCLATSEICMKLSNKNSNSVSSRLSKLVKNNRLQKTIDGYSLA